MDLKRTVLSPEYMEKFTCIGSECEDSCCIGWRVDIDKETYLKYKNKFSSDLKPLFDTYVSRNHGKGNKPGYGKIKMLPEGECPFLSEEKLCKIQLELGFDYLSETCALYPRNVNKVDGKLERSATISCPEIARIALLNEKGISFTQIKEDKNIKIKINSIFDTEGHLFYNKAQRYFWEIRLFSLNLLQNRNYSLSERLILLGIVYKKIENLEYEKRTHEISKMLETMEELVADGKLKKELDGVPVSLKIQMMITKELTDKKIVSGVKSERYMECFKETLMGIKYIVGGKVEEAFKIYEENTEKYYKPYIKEKEYILENYLVNEFFREMMPFGKHKEVWPSYIFLCLMYSMVKLHMIGMAGYHKGLTDDIMIKLIQSFSKVVLHNSNYMKNIVQIIENNKFDTLAYMAILVKN